LVLLVGTITLALVSGYLLSGLVDMLNHFFSNAAEIDVAADTRLQRLFYSYFIRLALPMIATAFVAAIAGNIFQVGFLFSTKPITPDFTKIIPRFGRFFKRAMFSGEAAFNLGKTLFKVALIAVVVFLNIRAEVPRLTQLARVPYMVGFRLIASAAFRIIVEVAVVLLVLSLPDYLFQRRQFMESLKMSQQEVKEERKQYEGDPLVRSRLRERMREILQRNMLKAVPRADVVITNPTHYSVALEWNREIMPAPTVVAKGVDSIALKIRELAEEAGVPLFENRPLARALYAEVEIGDVIPEMYYEVTATILAEIYRLEGRAVS
jgi:flagellar biosynthetic protein FlhB